MRILVAGAGAVGSVFGARLAASGQTVALVARGPHLAALQSKGLEVVGMFEAQLRLDAFSKIPKEGSWDVVILTCKTADLDGLTSDVAHRLPPTVTVALQNGLGIADRLFQNLGSSGGWADPNDWATPGVNSVPATLVSPGVVRQAGIGEVLFPGSIGRPRLSSDLDDLVEAFQRAGIPSHRVRDFDREVWRKLLVNAAINPVTADHGVLNGALIDDPWRAQTLELLSEARAVAAAEGTEITPEEAAADLWRVVRATANNRSSMLQDIERGRPTEIDAISGELVRRGRRHGLALPATQRALRRILRRAAPHSG